MNYSITLNKKMIKLLTFQSQLIKQKNSIYISLLSHSYFATLKCNYSSRYDFLRTTMHDPSVKNKKYQIYIVDESGIRVQCYNMYVTFC